MAPSHHPPTRLALPALVLGSIAIGASPIFVRLSELGPLATAFHRMAWALPLLYGWMRWNDRRGGPARPPWRLRDQGLVVLAGLLFVGDLAFWHASILATSVANATFFANFSPIVVTVGAVTLLGERVGWRLAAGLVLALVGAGGLAGASLEVGASHLRGDGLGLITALFFGAYMLVVASLRRHLPAATILFWSSLVSCLGLGLLAVLAGQPLLPHSLRGLLVLIALAWISQAAGQGLIAEALGFLPAGFSSLVILIEPVTAAALGWLLLAEPLGPAQAVGGALVLAGVLLARRGGDGPPD